MKYRSRYGYGAYYVELPNGHTVWNMSPFTIII